MQEDFLEYIWQFKKIKSSYLKTIQNQEVQIIKTGELLQYNPLIFINTQLIIDAQKWVGIVLIHLKTSDSYLSNTTINQQYPNIILHIVWEHDVLVDTDNNIELPILELQQYVALNILDNYKALKTKKTSIYCENKISNIPVFVLKNWQERLYIERLENKTKPIIALLQQNNNHWEATLFCFLAKSFGLNTNGDSFFEMATAIPFAIIQKEISTLQNIEALFFGTANLLANVGQDQYTQQLQEQWQYLQHKYQIKRQTITPPSFFRHRPDNFPTIRLAQLASLYNKTPHLFAKIIQTKQILYSDSIFDCSVSSYWQNHYVFDKKSVQKSKPLSQSFVNLILLNTILPFKFAYQQLQETQDIDNCITAAQQIPPEKNALIQSFASLGIPVPTAFETQALLELNKQYCSQGKCLQCAIGIELLNQ